MKAKTYKDLDVYQIAYRLSLDIHKITESFPKSEMSVWIDYAHDFGLIDKQIWQDWQRQYEVISKKLYFLSKSLNTKDAA